MGGDSTEQVWVVHQAPKSVKRQQQRLGLTPQHRRIVADAPDKIRMALAGQAIQHPVQGPRGQFGAAAAAAHRVE